MKILITGSAGFIGYHLSNLLLSNGHQVLGYDGLTDYYDVSLKERRNSMLLQNPNYSFNKGMLENLDQLQQVASDFQPDVIVHLAAQAGVRYSLENPSSYVSSNLVGTFNVMEISKNLQIQHLLMASTSSVYGANTEMPFSEAQNTDRPMTLYAATKKANEVMAHSYSHLWKIPTTMFRFFTVYGPWGRPDMALFRFVQAAKKNLPIEVYNYGDMSRDFTYVDDLVKSISLLVDKPPTENNDKSEKNEHVLNSLAPFQIVNIGNSKSILLMDFIAAIERRLGLQIDKNFMEMQMGDVPSTWADATLLKSLTGYTPGTSVEHGINQFISWYEDYYGK